MTGAVPTPIPSKDAPLILVPLTGLVLPWLLPLLRAILLVAPLLFVIDENVLVTRVCVSLVWAVLYQRWVFRTHVESTPDVVGDCVVVAQATLFLLLLVRKPSPLLLPLVSLVGLFYLLHLFYTQQPSPPPKGISTQWRPSVWMRALLTILMGAHGVIIALLLHLDDPVQQELVSVPNLLWALSSSCSVLLISRPFPLRYAAQWMALQLAMAYFLYGLSVNVFWMHLMLLGVLFVLLISSVRPSTARSIPFFSSLLTLITSSVEVAIRIIREPILYQLGVLFAFALLVGGITEDWHTSHVDFPDAIVKTCDFFLEVIGFIRPFYEISSNAYVQQILFPAAPEIGKMRMALHRMIEPAYPYLRNGSDGMSHTYSMTESLAALISFVLGPCLAVVAVLASIFPRGSAFANAPFYWLVTTLGCSLFFMVTQLKNGVVITFVRVLFTESHYTRTYTESGRMAYIASLLLIACSLALLFVTSAKQARTEWRRLLKKRNQNLPSAAASPALFPLRTGARMGYHEVGQQRVSLPWWRRFWAHVGGWMTSPILLLAASLFVFSIAIGTGSSPITSFTVVSVAETGPDWLIITPLDQVSLAAGTLMDFLVNALGVSGPEARLFLLLFAATRVALQEISCLPCLCVSLSSIEDALGDLGDKLNPGNWLRRRRLLNFVDELLKNGPTPRGGNFTFSSSSTYSHGRELLELQLEEYLTAGAICTSASESSCDGLKICASDVIKIYMSIQEFAIHLISDGLSTAAQLVLELIKRLIPVFDSMADSFLHLASLADLPDFDLYGLELNIGGQLPSLPQFLPEWSPPEMASLPAVPSLTSALVIFLLILALLLVSGHALDALGLVTRAALTLFLLQALALLALVLVIGYELVDEMKKTFKYKPVVTWDSSIVQLYALSFLLLVLAAFLFIMQTFFPSNEEEEREEEEAEEDEDTWSNNNKSSPSPSPPSAHAKPSKSRASSATRSRTSSNA